MKKYKTKKYLIESYYKDYFSSLNKGEISLLADLLILYSNNKFTKNAKDYLSRATKVGFNVNMSGEVFLVDENDNRYMNNNGKLDIFLFTPYGGVEGFPNGFNGEEIEDFKGKDIKYLKNFGEFKNGIYRAY